MKTAEERAIERTEIFIARRIPLAIKVTLDEITEEGIKIKIVDNGMPTVEEVKEIYEGFLAQEI